MKIGEGLGNKVFSLDLTGLKDKGPQRLQELDLKRRKGGVLCDEFVECPGDRLRPGR